MLSWTRRIAKAKDKNEVLWNELCYVNFEWFRTVEDDGEYLTIVGGEEDKLDMIDFVKEFFNTFPTFEEDYKKSISSKSTSSFYYRVQWYENFKLKSKDFKVKLRAFEWLDRPDAPKMILFSEIGEREIFNKFRRKTIKRYRMIKTVAWCILEHTVKVLIIDKDL
jgi:hypothetical protein